MGGFGDQIWWLGIGADWGDVSERDALDALNAAGILEERSEQAYVATKAGRRRDHPMIVRSTERDGVLF